MKFIRVSSPMLPIDSSQTEAYMTECGLGVLKSIDNTPKWGKLKHVSVSRQDRYPTWDEIVQVKEFFFGDIDVMMLLPKKKNYVNLHQNCFHLWQTPQEWEIM